MITVLSAIFQKKDSFEYLFNGLHKLCSIVKMVVQMLDVSKACAEGNVNAFIENNPGRAKIIKYSGHV